MLIDQSVFMTIPYKFYHYNSVIALNIRDSDLQKFFVVVLFFITQDCFGYLGFLLFHSKLNIVFSNSINNCSWIFMEIALNLYVDFGKVVIFAVLILSIHEHRGFFHLLVSFPITFIKDLLLLSYKPFIVVFES